MQFFTLATVAVLAGLANAQATCIDKALSVPPCATTCIESAASSIGNCGAVDFDCQCSNSAAISSACASSVVSQCGGVSSALAAQSAANAVCACASSNGPAVAAPRVTARAF